MSVPERISKLPELLTGRYILGNVFNGAFLFEFSTGFFKHVHADKDMTELLSCELL